MDSLLQQVTSYVPRDRLDALAGGPPVPERADGAVLLADLSGFTPLGEALTTELGAAAGAEELNHRVSTCFADLIAVVNDYHGAVVRFAGDALSCAFYANEPGLAGRRAASAAQAMQRAMAAHSPLRLRVGVGIGLIRRLLLGEPAHMLHDVLAGAALEAAVEAMQQARPGEIAAPALPPVEPTPWPAPALEHLGAAALPPFLLPEVLERLQAGLGAFLSELRLIVPIFIHIDCPTERLNDYVTLAERVAARFGGRISDVEVGDKGNVLVMTFGAPTSTGDDIRRALRCTLVLVQKSRGLAWVGPLWIGVSQGVMYSGTVGSTIRQTYAVYGDEMNVAARLMDAAGPGEILVSGQVYRACQKDFSCQLLAPLQLKGKAEPVPVARLLGLRAAAPVPVARARTLLGRQEELACIATCFAKAQRGSGQVLLIEGETGVGKSHLARAAVQRWSEAGFPAYRGDAPAEARHTPYFAWGALLRALLALPSEAPVQEQARQITAALAAIHPDRPQRLPLLATVLGLDIPDNDLTRHFDAELRRQSTRNLLLDLIRGRTREGPILLLLEDAHWLDELSAEVTVGLARACADWPVMVLLVARPLAENSSMYQALRRLSHFTGKRPEAVPLELPPAFSLEAPHQPVSGRCWPTKDLPPETPPPAVGSFTHLRLADLDRETTLALAARQLGVDSLPAEVAEMILVRGHGNPFYTTELALHLREGGIVQVKDKKLYVTSSLEDVAIPETVQGVVQARLDRLPETEKMTLKVASAIGHSFEVLVLDKSHPARPVWERLEEELQALEGAEFIGLETTDPELAYVFRHVITQEVTYGTLLFVQRRQLHGAIGRVIEELAPGEIDRLAYHFSRSDLADKALRYLQLAAERALRDYANEAAISYCTRALEIAAPKDAAVRYELLAGREQACNLLGQREAQRADLEELERLARALGGDQRPVEVHLRWAALYVAIGLTEEAIARGQQALEIARRSGDLRLVGNSHRELGNALWQGGALQEGLAHSREAARCLHEAGDQVGEAWSLYRVGRTLLHMEKIAEAKEVFEQTLALNRNIGNRQGEARCLNELGLALGHGGDFVQRRNHHEQALRIQRAIGDRKSQSSSLNDLAMLYLRIGLYEQALAAQQEVLEIDLETGDNWGIGIDHQNLGIIHCFFGQTDKALEHCRYGLQISQQYSHRFYEGFAWQYLGYTHEEREAWDEAKAAFRRAEEIHVKVGAAALCREDRLGLARTLLPAGRLDEARELVQEAMDLVSREGLGGMEFPLFLYLTGYQVFLACGEKERALKVLQQGYQRIVEQAEQLDDPAWRQAFLERAVPNRMIVAAAMEYSKEAAAHVV